MKKQANILFIPSSFRGNSAEPRDTVSHRGYFQRVIHASLARSINTIEGFRSLAEQLEAVARQAYWAKQSDVVEQATELMLALPISDQLEGPVRHYQALCMKQRGDFEGARRILERVAEEATPHYRARALQVIGATYFERGEVDSALPFYLAAGKAAVDCDALTLAASQQMIAVVRSLQGDHKQALIDLESLFPLVRAVGKHFPVLYYDFLNSLAVELGEVGRVGEAEAALSIALASPFSPAHPNWRETRDEISAKRAAATPAVIAVSRAPEASPSPQPEPRRAPRSASGLTLRWAAFWNTPLQRASTTIAARGLVPCHTQIILDRVLISISPRAPPACF